MNAQPASIEEKAMRLYLKMRKAKGIARKFATRRPATLVEEDQVFDPAGDAGPAQDDVEASEVETSDAVMISHDSSEEEESFSPDEKEFLKPRLHHLPCLRLPPTTTRVSQLTSPRVKSWHICLLLRSPCLNIKLLVLEGKTTVQDAICAESRATSSSCPMNRRNQLPRAGYQGGHQGGGGWQGGGHRGGYSGGDGYGRGSGSWSHHGGRGRGGYGGRQDYRGRDQRGQPTTLSGPNAEPVNADPIARQLAQQQPITQDNRISRMHWRQHQWVSSARCQL